MRLNEPGVQLAHEPARERREEAGSVSAALATRLREDIAAAGGWIAFDRFMHRALYEPGLGYYARGTLPFGPLARDGSDFITAPELSPYFARALAAQVAQGLSAAGAHEIVEFGAGSGALAAALLDALDARGVAVRRYTIVEVSGGLRQRQRERLVRFGERVAWVERWPDSISGVVIGNEVLDAMPCRLLAFDGERWCERGVALQRPTHGASSAETAFAFADRPTDERPPVPGPFVPGTVVEIQPQAQAFVRSLAERLQRGLALFIDYGFPQAELYHPQRTGGTLMCHRAHRADGDPLSDIGLKDITVHVDFTAMALAAQEADLDVAGYTSQGRFLLNCGLAEMLATATLPERAAAQKLFTEHEMGELFKVLALTRGLDIDLIGFLEGDRTHRL
jgi:SAM-dependent MidA family methyltransferase